MAPAAPISTGKGTIRLKALCEDNLEDLIKINDVVMIMEAKYDISTAIMFIEGVTLQ
jgi:hypothetical protein